MAIETKEITFEQEIEYSLLDHGGYIKGNPRDYNREFAIDTKQLFRFLQVSPSRKNGHEKARKNGMNHRNAEGCSLTLPGRSSVFQIAREKVLPKRSEAAACCKMLPCKRRRPPEQRRVSGTASGE